MRQDVCEDQFLPFARKSTGEPIRLDEQRGLLILWQLMPRAQPEVQSQAVARVLPKPRPARINQVRQSLRGLVWASRAQIRQCQRHSWRSSLSMLAIKALRSASVASRTQAAFSELCSPVLRIVRSGFGIAGATRFGFFQGSARLHLFSQAG